MSVKDSMVERRKALEEEYFARKNQEALQRLTETQGEPPRTSPITGEPMEKVTVHGVVIDRCKTSGGVWLDAGELEQLIEASASEEEAATSWIQGFFKSFSGGS